MGDGNTQAAVSRPPFWTRLSVIMGNLVQLAGLVLGSVVIVLSARLDVTGLFRIGLFVVGWFIVYICCHSLAHWAVGRLVGIRFREYGLRGTDHPEEFGSVMRRVMSLVPMFTAITDKDSMRQARPVAKALMFAAGETSTIVCTLLASIYAWQNDIPGGPFWVIVALALSMSAILSTLKMPKGDYAKAVRALRGNS